MPRQERKVEFLDAPRTGLTIPRTALRQRLLKAWPCLRVATIVAPAGYGKTIALDQVCSDIGKQDVRVVRLRMPGDCSAHSFVRQLIAAFKRVDAQRVRSGPGSDHLGSLIENIHASGASYALIIDDVEPRSEAGCCKLLSSILRQAPSNLRFVFAGRGEIPLPVGLFRVRGELCEYVQTDLCFSGAEVEALADLKGVEGLDPITSRDLLEITEGWPAGIQLFLTAAFSSGYPVDVLREFNGKDRGVADYFRETVVARLPSSADEFAQRLCSLESFSIDLCRELFPDQDVSKLFGLLEASGAFLVALDRQRHCYRFHRLFLDYLRAHAAERIRKNWTADRSRAARWFAEAGNLKEAVSCALAAGDDAYAVEIIERFLPDLHKFGGYPALLDWLRRLPEESYANNLDLRFAKTLALLLAGSPKLADAEARRLEIQYGVSAQRNASMIRCLGEAISGDPTAAREACLAWFENWGASTGRDTAIVGLGLSVAYLRASEIKSGLSESAWTRKKFQRAGAVHEAAWCAAIEARLHMVSGALQAAKSLLEAVLAPTERALGSQSRAASMLAALLAEAAVELGDITQAEAFLERVSPGGGDESTRELETACFDTAVKVGWWRRDAKGVAATLSHGEGLSGNGAGFAHAVAAEKIVFLLRQGQYDEASTLLQKLERECPDSDIATRERLHLCKARILLHQGCRKQALSQLNTLCVELRRRNRRLTLITAMLLKAACLDRSGIERDALRILEDALSLAEKTGAAGRIVAERDLVGELISAYAERRPLPSHEEGSFWRLVSSAMELSKPTGTLSSEREQPTGPTLTAKEQRVLSLLADGMTNRELAEALFLSEKTIKWHLRNIFEKLGVENRTSAVALARKMLLIN